MTFKLIARLKPDIGFREVLSAMNIFSRVKVSDFEKAFAKKFEKKYGIMFQHGRSGLYTLLKIWGLHNAEVICPAYTCVVVPHAIVLSGNIPVFVDCAPNSPNMDYTFIEKSINKKTRAIIVTHLFGYPMDVRRIENIIRQAEKKYNHKIFIIQDVAHAFGCEFQGEPVVKSGDAALFGLNISKTITSIFGGMILTDDKDYANQLLKFRQQNQKQSIFKPISRMAYLISVLIAFNPYIYKIINWLENRKILDIFVKYYEEDKIYFPSDWEMAPSKIEARVGLVQLKKYDQIVARRSRNAQAWMQVLQKDKIYFFDPIEGCTYSHCAGRVKNRDEWVKKYKKKGVQLGILIEYCIPHMPAYKDFNKDSYPISEYYSKHMINFPVWFDNTSIIS